MSCAGTFLCSWKGEGICGSLLKKLILDVSIWSTQISFSLVDEHTSNLLWSWAIFWIFNSLFQINVILYTEKKMKSKMLLYLIQIKRIDGGFKWLLCLLQYNTSINYIYSSSCNDLHIYPHNIGPNQHSSPLSFVNQSWYLVKISKNSSNSMLRQIWNVCSINSQSIYRMVI